MHADRVIQIRYPYTGEVVATVPKATVEDVRRALKVAYQYKPKLTRHERYKILMKAGDLIAIMTAGAYGAVQSGFYNTRPLVPEVLVKDDQYAVVRPRIEVEELIAMDKPAPWL